MTIDQGSREAFGVIFDGKRVGGWAGANAEQFAKALQSGLIQQLKEKADANS